MNARYFVFRTEEDPFWDEFPETMKIEFDGGMVRKYKLEKRLYPLNHEDLSRLTVVYVEMDDEINGFLKE